MPGSYKELLVKIGLDSSSVQSGLSSVIGQFGSLGPAALGAAGIAVTAVAAIGAAAFKVGLDFEQASKTIRSGTGATGEALEGLEASFKKAFANSDDSIEEVSQTLADLNTATGLTGTALEGMTGQMLDLKDLGVGFSGDVQTLTRVFGDWGDSIQNPSTALDFLYKTAQSTGAGVDELAQKVVQFGAPLRQLGFDFEESAALFGKWQKEGVNTETVMGGMRIGLANLSKAGGDVPAAFQGVLESIKAAGSTAEANGIAFEVFGQRAGADMAAAVREGRFSIDELVESLNASSDTITGVADETQTLGEKFAELSNKAQVALEPLGTFLVDVLASALDDVNAVWETWSIWIQTTGELFAAAGIQLWDFTGGVKGIGESIRDFLIGYAVKANEILIGLAKTLNGFPVIGGQFDSSIAIMEKGLARMKGIVETTTTSIGTPTKPTSFTGSVKVAEAKVFDLEKALKAAADEAKEFEKGLEDAREKGAEEFADEINSGAIPALVGLDRVSGTTANAMLSDMLAMAGGVDPLITKLEDIPPKTKDVEAAFESLETKGTAELQQLYDEAKRNFDLIQDSGEATPMQINEAWRNELEALQALYRANGQELSEEEQKILNDLNAKLKTGTEQMKGTWTQFAEDVGATISSLGSQLFSDLLEGKFSLSNVTSALKSIKDAFVDALFKPVADAIDSFIANSIDKLLGKLVGPDGISGALDKVFGGGGGSTPGVPGAPGGAPGGGGGGPLGSLAGLANPLTAIFSGISAVSSVFSYFKQGEIETGIDAVDKNTLVSAVHLGYLLENSNTWWPKLGELEGIHAQLRWLNDRNAEFHRDAAAADQDLLDSVSRLDLTMGRELPSIRTSVEGGADRVSAEIRTLAAAVDRIADRTIQVSVDIDGEVVGRTAEEYIHERLY